MKLQEPIINENTSVKYIDRPSDLPRPRRKYKKKNTSTVTEYDANFEIVNFHILRFKD